MIFRDKDADPTLLAGVAIGVVGFGNQGRAQALCLRDAGHDVRVLVRAGGASEARARADGFDPSPPDSLAECGAVALLAPDEAHERILAAWIHPHVPPGALLVVAHGFSLQFGGLDRVRADLDVALVGPLGPGTLLRERFVAGGGLAGLLAVVRDATGRAGPRALAYASALRLTRAGVIATTLEEEVTSDLFAEQVVLTGGVVELMRAAWETLVAGGVSEDVAYYSCVQELKQILDLVHADGVAGMRERISSTALWGGLTRGPRILGEGSRAEMRRILSEIRSGAFAREWAREREEGAPRLAGLVQEGRDHPIEEAGRRVRESLGGEVDTPGGAT